MAEQKVDAYGGTIFSGAGDVLTRCPQDAFAQMRAVAVRSVDSFPMVLGESV